MAFSNILLLSAALLLAFFNLSSGNPALDQANATVSAVNKTNALEGAHHVLRLGGNGSALNHDVQSSYIYCSSSSTCWRSSTGYSSTCYNGYCVCDIGYHLNTYDQCVQTTCTFDSDCSQAETRCNFNNKCVCNYGYYQDPTSQTCKYSYYPSSGGGAGETVGFSFGGFIFLIIVISLCVLCCRNRRQRIVRVVGPNVQQQQQQQQPRPGFVQPQPGYAYQQQQGYQQGYQQQQQQQPMPMPQPSAYPNPNYQQQQVQQQQQAPPPPYNPAFAASPSGYPSIGGKI